MIEFDRLAANLHRLSDRSVTELRKCVIIVAGLSADYEIEVRMLDNNPAGLERADIERVVGNQYNRPLRQQRDSKALSASGSTTTTDHGEKRRRPRNRFGDNSFNCGRKAHRAEYYRSAKKKIEKSRDATADKGRGRGKCFVCGSEKHFAHKHCDLCRSPERRTRDCEKRGDDKGMMPAKLDVASKGATAAMVGAGRGDGKEEWDSGSGALFHTSHAQVGMTAYKKAPTGTTIEVADEIILPMDGFGTGEADTGPAGYYDQASEHGFRCVCARTFTEPAVHPQSSEAMK